MTQRKAADARVAAMLARDGASLMRVARQWSLCHDDALDAFQRGLEIYVRRLDTVDRATEAAWLKVVIRHEALAIRRSRADCVTDAGLDLDATLPAAERSVEEQVLSGDRVRRSAEALRALKPDEARALMLKAHGMSYEEIGRHCGWTYTKVNRAITEGRRRFMEVYEALDAGEECERYAPILQALAAGTASGEQLVAIRPHLRRCTACRATVRELHRDRLRRLRLLLPLVVPLRWLRDRLASAPDAKPPSTSLPDAGERFHRLHRIKQDITSLMHRTNSSDVAAGIHIATTTGGGRIATLGAIVGLCLSGIGAGTVCVVTGIVGDPLGIRGEPLGGPPHHYARAPAPDPRRARAARPLSAELRPARVTPTPTPTPAPKPKPRRTRVHHVTHRTPRPAPAPAPAPTSTPPPATVDPSQGTTPTSQEHAPISPAPTQPATQEFSAAPTSGSGTQSPPAAAPATGGEEFGP